MTRRRIAAQPDAYLLYLIYVVVALGTLVLEQVVRQAVLWTLLMLMGIVYRGHHVGRAEFSLRSLMRGALLGLAISLPILVLLQGQLYLFFGRLFDGADAVPLFYQACFVDAPAEGCFFRGIVQPQKGLPLAVGLAAVAGLLFYAPRLDLLAALVLAAGTAALAALLGYVRDQHGLAASVACHVVAAFTLQVMPSVLRELSFLI
ncbi:MAG: hypothetical protein JXA74_10110 [Anaerolineae bacterium]|nr:hypothetical protein [Anaerolineae bacterium]